MNSKDTQENSAVQEELNSTLDINSDENVNGNQHLNEPLSDDNETEKLREQIAQLNDKYLRQVGGHDQRA